MDDRSTAAPGAQGEYEVRDRRPMKPREWRAMQVIASGLASAGWTANAISVLSVVFAVLGGAAVAATVSVDGWAARGLWLAGALLIELRALCNLFDGMVAVQTKTASPVGELYNEVPDRFSDVAMLVGFGVAAGSVELGVAAACTAVMVAYVRAQAAAAGAGQDYCGPMAKPVRMQAVAIACVCMVVMPQDWLKSFWGEAANPIKGGAYLRGLLWVIVFGCAVTVGRRLRRASLRLRKAAA